MYFLLQLLKILVYVDFEPTVIWTVATPINELIMDLLLK